MSSIKSTHTQIIDPRPRNPFQIVAKKYVPHNSDPKGYTLLFAHGTGFHKEQWEPTIERIFELANAEKWGIREAWSVDAPNHGDAAVLNEKLLRQPFAYSKTFVWDEYAKSLHLFLTISNLHQNKLIALGHSMGAVSLVSALQYAPQIKYEGIFLVEPMMFPLETPLGQNKLLDGATGRRDIWDSKAAAFEWLCQRRSFKAWNQDVLKIFCKHGLRALPTVEYPDKEDGVTLKCTKFSEAASYREPIAHIRTFQLLPSLCHEVPVHVIFGSINDAVPPGAQDALVKSAKGKLRSVQRVEGAGHLVVQTHPKGLAEHIFAALTGRGEQRPQSKL